MTSLPVLPNYVALPSLANFPPQLKAYEEKIIEWKGTIRVLRALMICFDTPLPSLLVVQIAKIAFKVFIAKPVCAAEAIAGLAFRAGLIYARKELKLSVVLDARMVVFTVLPVLFLPFTPSGSKLVMLLGFNLLTSLYGLLAVDLPQAYRECCNLLGEGDLSEERKRSLDEKKSYRQRLNTRRNEILTPQLIEQRHTERVRDIMREHPWDPQKSFRKNYEEALVLRYLLVQADLAAGHLIRECTST